MSGYRAWRTSIENRFHSVATPLCTGLTALHAAPNGVTLFGCAIGAAGGIFFASGSFFRAAVAVALAGICDVLDGHLARQTGRVSAFGAFLDSTIDRFSEIFWFSALVWYFSPVQPAMAAVSALAVAGSLMVSYTRARAEALGVSCAIGLMQRPERMVLLIAGAALAKLPVIGEMLFNGALIAIALLSNVSAVHRIVHVHGQLTQPGK